MTTSLVQLKQSHDVKKGYPVLPCPGCFHNNAVHMFHRDLALSNYDWPSNCEKRSNLNRQLRKSIRYRPVDSMRCCCCCCSHEPIVVNGLWRGLKPFSPISGKFHIHVHIHGPRFIENYLLLPHPGH